MMTVTLAMAVLLAAPPSPAEAVYVELGLPGPVNVKPLPKEYLPDDVTAETIRKNSKQYPVRAAVLDALEVLRQARETVPAQTEMLQADLEKPLTLKAIYKKQEGPAIAIALLEDVRKNLQSLEAVRHRDPSPRWQAHFDFVLAEVEFRLAQNHEYNEMLANLRLEILPPLNASSGQVGWRLVPTQAMKSRQPIRVIAGSALDRFESIASGDPDTPWAILATRFKDIPPGMRWLPMTNLVDQ